MTVSKELNNMRNDIAKAKRKLEKRNMTENFGCDEVRRIQDKYFALQQNYYSEYSQLIQNY